MRSIFSRGIELLATNKSDSLVATVLQLYRGFNILMPSLTLSEKVQRIKGVEARTFQFLPNIGRHSQCLPASWQSSSGSSVTGSRFRLAPYSPLSVVPKILLCGKEMKWPFFRVYDWQHSNRCRWSCKFDRDIERRVLEPFLVLGCLCCISASIQVNNVDQLTSRLFSRVEELNLFFLSLFLNSL